MNEQQVFRALDAIFDALSEIEKISEHALDPKDSRILALNAATNKLHDVLYIEDHPKPTRYPTRPRSEGT